jgi:4-hydroxybenzoate polyprenyltransferase
MTSPDPANDTSNPLTRAAPLGGRTGVAIASIVPIVCVVLFLALGFLVNGWSWSWIILIAIPIVFLIVYGPRDRSRRR